jgi:hypothetical protein
VRSPAETHYGSERQVCKTKHGHQKIVDKQRGIAIIGPTRIQQDDMVYPYVMIYFMLANAASNDRRFWTPAYEVVLGLN